MKEILQYIQLEWSTVSAAPATFALIFVLACGIAYRASKWKHSATIDLLHARLAAKDQELDGYRKQASGNEIGKGVLPNIAPPKIELCIAQAAPYHMVTARNGHWRSTVAIGIRNSGGQTFSNCRVYIEQIAPPLCAQGANTLLLDDTGFQLRSEDPERLVEVAHRWGHHNQSKFSTPQQGGFFDTGMWMDDGTRRKFAIRVAAKECERSAMVEMWTDESKQLHLRLLNYLN